MSSLKSSTEGVDRDFVSIGRIGQPKGIRGDLKVHSYSGESGHFFGLEQVELRGQGANPKRLPASNAVNQPKSAKPSALSLKVVRIEGDADSLTMAFEGYACPEDARVLTGMDIIVPRALAAPLGPNQWYIDDLIGLALVGASGERLGEVLSVLEGGAEPWLEVLALSSPAAQGVERDAERVSKRDAERVSKRNAERVSLVPFRKEFVGEVDIAGGTIELLAPWLLEK